MTFTAVYLPFRPNLPHTLSTPSGQDSNPLQRNRKDIEDIRRQIATQSIMSLLDSRPSSSSQNHPTAHSLSFFPPFDASPEYWSDTPSPESMLFPASAATQQWVRPTACTVPNPPRQRDTAIGFATTSFKTFHTPSPVLFEKPSIPVPQGVPFQQLEKQQIPLWVRPTACPHPNPPRERTAPIGFAATSFKSISPNANQRVVELPPTDTPAVGPPNDESVQGPMSETAHPNIKPTYPPRRRTEPILFASTNWVIPAVPSSPPQMSPDIVEPVNHNIHDWSPVYLVDVPLPKRASPDTKWMDLPTLPVQYDIQVALPTPSTSPKCTHQRLQSNDSDATIRPASASANSDGLDATVQIPHPGNTYTAPESPPIEGMVEIPVRTIHPKLKRFSRPVSPILPDEVHQSVGLDRYQLSPPRSPSLAARDTLVGVWSKHNERMAKKADKIDRIDISDDSQNGAQTEDRPQTPVNQIIHQDKPPKTPSPRRHRPLLRRNSARSSLRDIFTPPVPPSSPNIIEPNKVFPTLSPRSLVDSDPFDEWIPTVRPRDVFDVNAVSARLRATVGMVDFHEVDGLGFPGEVMEYVEAGTP